MADGTIALTTEGGQTFSQHYYSYMDTGRSNLAHSTLALWRPRVPRCSAGKCPGPMRCLPMLKLHLFGMRGEGRSQSHLYHEESKVVWNGNSIKGRQNVERFLTDLPASKHEPCSLDCQPVKPQGALAPGQEAPDPMILVSVMGTVQYGLLEAKPPPEARPFTQSFVLGKDTATGSYYIVTDNYRLL